MGRTEEEMKEILADKLYVGKKVRVERWNSVDGKNRGDTREVRRGEVVGLYPHIFTVRFGNFLESFRYSQVFTTGGERVVLSW